MNIFDYNPKDGMGFQGDLIIFPVPADSFDRIEERAESSQFLTLLEGEASGHHHCIDLLSAQVTEALESIYASELVPTAKVFRDIKSAAKFVEDTSLFIGFLEIQGSPFLLKHVKEGVPTEEHDALRIRVGTYYVGRQRQFDAGQAQFVAD